MVGHTGDVKAAITAVETVDECVGRVVEKLLSKGGQALITADHGNAELMQDPENKTTITAHSINPVPFIVVSEELKSAKLKEDGRLSDIAPTVLSMMNLDKPEQMTGESLIIKK
jgi:2,3-bisphosphoglycerate-independent phosphoglycerate mutase